MFKEHPDVKLDFPDSASIWRYTTLGKLVALLSDHALYFNRLDTLNDPFEGALSNVEPPGDDTGSHVTSMMRNLMYTNGRRLIYVNCWHANEYESAAMWQLYTLSGEGVAIKSTIGDLKRSFAPTDSKQVYIGSVKYVDYDREFISMSNAVYPALRKRHSFEHEHEVRCLAIETTVEGGRVLFEKQPAGVKLPVDLKALIQQLYVAPDAPDWYATAVAAVCEKFGLRISPVIGMSERPMY